MSEAAYVLAVFALIIALDNHQSIKEIRYHYNKLYKDNIYGKCVTLEEYKVGPEDSHEQ